MNARMSAEKVRKSSEGTNTIDAAKNETAGQYSSGSFIAVISAQLNITPFWIGKVKQCRSFSDKRKKDMILVEWYQVEPTAQDPFESSYTPAINFLNGVNVAYESWISLERVITAFDGFDEGKKLREETKDVIRGALLVT